MTLIISVGRVETTRVSAVVAAHPVLAFQPATSVATSAHRDRLPVPHTSRYGVADVQRPDWRTETGRHGACGATGGATTGNTSINDNFMKFSSRLGRSCSPPV